jgi:hypothetical protein
LDAVDEVFGEREAKVGAVELHASKAVAFHHRR